MNTADAHKGVDVSLVDGSITVNLYIIIEYGTRISEIARNVRDKVRYVVENATGLQVTDVRIHVQGVKVSPG